MTYPQDADRRRPGDRRQPRRRRAGDGRRHAGRNQRDLHAARTGDRRSERRPARPRRRALPVQLDDGDVFQIYSGAMGEDLTGAEVSADVPRWRSSRGTSRPPTVRRSPGSTPPTWRTSRCRRVRAGARSTSRRRMTPQASIGCTSFFGMDGASIWRVVASQDGTTGDGGGTGHARRDVPRSTPARSSLVVTVGSFTVTRQLPDPRDPGDRLRAEPLAGGGGRRDDPPHEPPVRRAAQLRSPLAIVRPSGAEVDLDATADQRGHVPAGRRRVRRRLDPARSLRPHRRQRRLHAPARLDLDDAGSG